jgi:serine/threonine-protein kinase HipA
MGSYEAVARQLSEIPGAGLVEAAEFIKRSILMYIVGNGDFHLKNTSLIYTKPGAPSLSPAYDVVNTMFYGDPQFLCLDFLEGNEEPASYSALGYPSLVDFIEVASKVGIGERTLKNFAESFLKKLPDISTLIENSMLSDLSKNKYSQMVQERAKTLVS